MATYKIQHRNDTTANWNTHNPILLKGEIGIEFQSSNNVAWKIGDGVTAWKNLPYCSGPQGPQGPAGSNGSGGSSGFRAPKATYTDYDGQVGFTAPTDGWIHIRAKATGSALSIGVMNDTTGIHFTSSVSVTGMVASITMPVRAGDAVSPTLYAGTLTEPICRFHPGN